MISKPPMPEPIKTPTRSAFSGVMRRPDWAMASWVAAKAKWMKRPILRDFFFVHKIQRVKVLDLGGEGDREASGIEALNRAHTTFAGQKLPPYLGSGVAHTANQTEAGDDDSA